MSPPDRFRSATFESFDAATPSQAEALTAARDFVEEQRRTPSMGERLRRVLGLDGAADPEGLYFVGPAGTGKTHLLAAAYHALTPAVPCAFLHSSTLFRTTEPPRALAHRLADRHAVCCLDEVEIDDPANEMRLVQWMKTLSARNVPLLATSNVTPEQYLSGHFSGGRFERFLHEQFQERYRIVFVEGPDYRRHRDAPRDGTVWVGPPERTRSCMCEAYTEASGPTRRYTFDELRRASTEQAPSDLLDTLTAADHLFVENVSIANTDDALRLLRIIDALYLHPEAPTLHFTATTPPDDWFSPGDHAGLAKGVAEKFARTVSRLHALCTVHEVGEPATAEAAASE